MKVSMGRETEKAMLISLLTSGEQKIHTHKNARYETKTKTKTL